MVLSQILGIRKNQLKHGLISILWRHPHSALELEQVFSFVSTGGHWLLDHVVAPKESIDLGHTDSFGRYEKFVGDRLEEVVGLISLEKDASIR